MNKRYSVHATTLIDHPSTNLQTPQFTHKGQVLPLNQRTPLSVDSDLSLHSIMDDTVADEDTKQFDAVNGTHDEDTQPDPDEPLMMDAGNGRVWLVKIPRFLMERWSAIDAENVHLASLRVYHNAKSSSGRKPRIVLRLPPDPATPDVEGDEYEMDMVNDSVENQVVVAEREKEPGKGSRARTTILTGRVKHECSLRPVFSDRYRQRLKERHRAANMPARQIQLLNEAPGERGALNMLTSGVSNTRGFSDLIVRRALLSNHVYSLLLLHHCVVAT